MRRVRAQAPNRATDTLMLGEAALSSDAWRVADVGHEPHENAKHGRPAPRGRGSNRNSEGNARAQSWEWK
jgi:hypothetical protein